MALGPGQVEGAAHEAQIGGRRRRGVDREPAGVARAPEGYFRRGVEVLRGIGNDAQVARGLEQYGRFKIENGAAAAGTDLLREALAIYARLGLRRGEQVEAQLRTV